MSIGPLGTISSDVFIKIQNLSSLKILLKISSLRWQTFCPGGDESNHQAAVTYVECHELRYKVRKIYFQNHQQLFSFSWLRKPYCLEYFKLFHSLLVWQTSCVHKIDQSPLYFICENDSGIWIYLNRQLLLWHNLKWQVLNKPVIWPHVVHSMSFTGHKWLSDCSGAEMGGNPNGFPW